MEERYDLATKVWTTVLGILVAGIIDWPSVVLAGRHHDDVHVEWWLLGVVAAVLSPAAWVAGHGSRKEVAPAVVWLVVLGLAFLAQVGVRRWLG